MMNVTPKLLAQVPKDIGTIGQGEGFGPYNFTAVANPLIAVAKVVSFLVGIITLGAGIYFIFQLLTASLEWMIASSDKSKLSKAQERLTHAFMGLILVVASYFIAATLSDLFHVDFLLRNPITIIQKLQLGR